MSSCRSTDERVARTLIASLLLPLVLPAQAIVLRDPEPAATIESRYAGGRLMPSGVVSQFDSVGTTPMATVGDSVTMYLFADGEHLSRVQHARVTARKRFLPPASWRAACDEVAHAGWFYDVSPAAHAPFAVIVPGTFSGPTVRPLPPAVRDGAWQFYRAVADSSYQRYRIFLHPASERAVQYAYNDFWGSSNDARYSTVKMFGVRGPNGASYAALSFTLRDDYPTLPNTARTWVLDAWGYPVASLLGDVDIYGTVDDGGIDAIVTSSGLIRWDGVRWQLPVKYSEEPCLYHQTMPLPEGAKP